MAQEKDLVICSTQLPISNTILKLSGVVDSNVCHETDYQDCFMLALSNPKAFWKERMSEEQFDVYLKEREFNLIKDDFEDLNKELYINNKEYREVTLNMIFDAKVDMLKNL